MIEENTDMMISEEDLSSYKAWLQYKQITNEPLKATYLKMLKSIHIVSNSNIVDSAVKELLLGIEAMLGRRPTIEKSPAEATIILETITDIEVDDRDRFSQVGEDGFEIIVHHNFSEKTQIFLAGQSEKGVLYAVFSLLRSLQLHRPVDRWATIETPKNRLRMINQWDNIDGTIERGYAGCSIFFKDNTFRENIQRIKDYARLLASVGINAISINNVNVWDIETNLITREYLPKVRQVSDIFNRYGISMFLSINYASPITMGELDTADPLDKRVKVWWEEKVRDIYRYIPNFGGFVVKADSEGRSGPFSYNRDHADGANMLAQVLKPFNGIVVWRCFVYNHLQDWRDRQTDRARAAYDHFKPIDGKFLDNVILQIKNGPMDFQVREPISPLLGGLKETNYMLELQITQEYTGQQIDLCYLIPQWKEILNFDTHAKGEGTKIKDIVNGDVFGNRLGGIAAVSNIGDNMNWTGHTLAQANLYGFGRLTWDPDLSTEEITQEWVNLTFGHNSQVVENIQAILLKSWLVYENYSSPLGIGWMVNPNHHYGPNIDGYEYSKWGTYHYADRDGIGVDRTVDTGTGYAGQYFSPNAEIYNNLEKCPDELLLFFQHVSYRHVLQSGKTVIQHIYDTHFDGVEQVKGFIDNWCKLEGEIDQTIFNNVRERLQLQLQNAIEWRDQVNTYFYRKSGISDQHNRMIY
ncbi:alpha-glucuronidase family glycosyl hydrolase [Amphibacillus cookii]|uniref:alpha-glucuronidase family glycosyl hydrolase n=1 Tax=Amphibacillus cookii TaxID=767787 RepID=UPI001EF78237|nr:alpha-glucuronidase family glycosyl hydrolase [Amphibacillus cookii]MBM7540300.1 alpha-glucuronidase [Amphibacillus cookii]